MVTATVRCLADRGAGCGWTFEGPDPDEAELAARRHSGDKGLKDGPIPPHPTHLEVTP